MTPLIIALVSFATALVAGVLLGKAFFTASALNDAVNRDAHHRSLSNQRKRYRKQLVLLHTKAQDKLAAQRKKIAKLAQVVEALQAAPEQIESNKEFYDGKVVESLRVEIAVLRENLGGRDARVGELELEIQDGHVKAQELLTNLNTWKNRVAPLTIKLDEQRKLIDSMTVQAGKSAQPMTPGEATSTEEADVTEVRIPDRPDDLKKIRGIGPALERRLNTSGVSRFEQIAGLSAQDLSDLAEKISISPLIAEREKWIQQARTLTTVEKPALQPAS